MTSSDRPMDYEPQEPSAGRHAGGSDLEKHVKARKTWIRLLFMILFVFLYSLSRLVVLAVVAIQFFHMLFTGATNEQLKQFGHSLAIYSFEIVNYLTFNTEIRPFPLDAGWPERLPTEEADSWDD